MQIISEVFLRKVASTETNEQRRKDENITSLAEVATGIYTYKAKFHYAVQLASRSQTSARPNSITLSCLRPAREQVCEQLASWFAS